MRRSLSSGVVQSSLPRPVYGFVGTQPAIVEKARRESNTWRFFISAMTRARAKLARRCRGEGQWMYVYLAIWAATSPTPPTAVGPSCSTYLDHLAVTDRDHLAPDDPI